MLSLQRVGKRTLHLLFDDSDAVELEALCSNAIRGEQGSASIDVDLQMFGRHGHETAQLSITVDERRDEMRLDGDVLQWYVDADTLEHVTLRLAGSRIGQGFIPAEIADLKIPGQKDTVHLYGIVRDQPS